MATFVLIPGAGGEASFWHPLVGELTVRGHDAVAVDLPADDDTAGLAEYADVVVAAIGDRTGRSDLVLVAQSLAGFTAPLVCDRVRVEMIVLLAAIVPAPGESPGEWGENTGQRRAMAEHAARHGTPATLESDEDIEAMFFHDVPPDITAEAM
jgi:pimeloyl-ACP methyl ester carboxylesterase